MADWSRFPVPIACHLWPRTRKKVACMRRPSASVLGGVYFTWIILLRLGNLIVSIGVCILFEPCSSACSSACTAQSVSAKRCRFCENVNKWFSWRYWEGLKLEDTYHLLGYEVIPSSACFRFEIAVSKPGIRPKRRRMKTKNFHWMSTFQTPG